MLTAKPTPEFTPVVEKIWVLIPITRPSASTSGPPELPGLMAASVCTMSTPSTTRSTPLTMPAVTDCSSPKGLPSATASCPTRSSAPRASSATGRSVRFSTLTTATSLSRWAPTTNPTTRRPSAKRTSTLKAPSTTWAAVRM